MDYGKISSRFRRRLTQAKRSLSLRMRRGPQHVIVSTFKDVFNNVFLEAQHARIAVSPFLAVLKTFDGTILRFGLFGRSVAHCNANVVLCADNIPLRHRAHEVFIWKRSHFSEDTSYQTSRSSSNKFLRCRVWKRTWRSANALWKKKDWWWRFLFLRFIKTAWVVSATPWWKIWLSIFYSLSCKSDLSCQDHHQFGDITSRAHTFMCTRSCFKLMLSMIRRSDFQGLSS